MSIKFPVIDIDDETIPIPELAPVSSPSVPLMYTIGWHSIATGFTSGGEKAMPAIECAKMVNNLNNQHRGVIYHYLVPATEGKTA